MIHESAITCPACGHVETERMLTNACQHFYDCKGCGAVLKPNPGDCCVFCSSGTVPCPPVQASKGGPLCRQSEEGSVTTEIRRGVPRPDWSVVTKPAARAALLGCDRTRMGRSEKWQRALSTSQDLVWRTVLELFGRLGESPSLSQVGDKIGLPPDEVRMHLMELQTRDLLGMDHETDNGVMARAEKRWRVRLALPNGLIERAHS